MRDNSNIGAILLLCSSQISLPPPPTLCSAFFLLLFHRQRGEEAGIMPLLHVYIHEAAEGSRRESAEIHNSDQHGGLSGAETEEV